MPRLAALSTAVPPYPLNHADIQQRARGYFAGSAALDLEHLLPVFANAGIDTRYSCVPVEWYDTPHGWTERNAIYLENAVQLLEKAARDALQQAALAPDQIDAIVVASTTGIATPSLDAILIGKLGLRSDVRRLPIFGLGCAGGVLGLARAADIARVVPGGRVLFLVVELCALSFRKGDLSKSNVVATALGGDGDVRPRAHAGCARARAHDAVGARPGLQRRVPLARRGVNLLPIVVALVAAERLAELVYSARNTSALKARGAVEIGTAHYPLIVLLHAAWIAALLFLVPWDTPHAAAR